MQKCKFEKATKYAHFLFFTEYIISTFNSWMELGSPELNLVAFPERKVFITSLQAMFSQVVEQWN